MSTAERTQSGWSAFWRRIQGLSPLAKLGLAAAGYVAALLVAIVAVWIHIAQTSGPEAQAASGMYAFGDAMLFLAIFGAGALVPTGVAFIFLRQSEVFWLAVTLLVLGIAATGPIAVLGIVVDSRAWWAVPVVPRTLLSPLFAATFGLSAAFAPAGRFRLGLLIATLIEAAVSLYGFFHWFAPLLNSAPAS